MDGQGHYLSRAVPALAEAAGEEVEVLALRIGDQPELEAGDGWRVRRVEPAQPLASVFDVYLPQHFAQACQTLSEAAVTRAKELSGPVCAWCHGYETGTAVEALAAAGHRVVGVAHYLVGQETLHDLAVGDDPVRDAAFESPWASAVGRAVPARLREMTVRWSARAGTHAAKAPLPAAIRTQFLKLDQERRFVRHAHQLVAVGPRFGQAMNRIYPCTAGRTLAIIAGAPAGPLPPPQWPLPDRPGALRLIAVGRPTGQKGWDYLAEALVRIEAEDPGTARKIELVILGGVGEWSGPYSAYAQRVAASLDGLRHVKIANLGTRPHTEVLAHLRGAHALVHPAVFEPLGLVILEAMAAGCVVLASNADGPRDLLEAPYGECMDFSDPARRTSALIQGICGLVRLDRQTLLDRGALAAEAARDHTWAGCARAHLTVLRT
jgi:glycosyltransferase involved in cell wall biosynthesis